MAREHRQNAIQCLNKPIKLGLHGIFQLPENISIKILSFKEAVSQISTEL